MSSSFELLSIELVEIVVTCLELEDIRSLRLTCRTLEEKASKGYFTTFFVHRNVELTTKNLQDMIKVTDQGRLGCHLRHCTITGIAQDEAEAEGEGEEAEHSRLLATAFTNLKQYSQNNGLASLCLGIKVIQGPDLGNDAFGNEIPRSGPARSWRTIWDVAASTFTIAAKALLESQLPVYEKMDVFSTVKGCSLNCKVFLAFAREFVASPSIFQSLKTFSMSLSAPHTGVLLTRDTQTTRASENQKEHSSSTLWRLPQLMRMMPKLEDFDLHWHFLGQVRIAPPPSRSSSSEADSSSSLSVTNLQHCALRGVWASETDLLHFFQSTNPISLTMVYVHLIAPDMWNGVFNYIKAASSPVNQYHIDDICEEYRLVHYNGIPGTSKFRYSNGPRGPSTVTRLPGHAKEPLILDSRPRRALGSGIRYYWSMKKWEEFGPPIRTKYDFVKLNSPPQVNAVDPDEGSEES